MKNMNKFGDHQEDEIRRDDISDALTCPIMYEIMNDPLTLSSGITYDREALTRQRP